MTKQEKRDKKVDELLDSILAKQANEVIAFVKDDIHIAARIKEQDEESQISRMIVCTGFQFCISLNASQGNGYCTHYPTKTRYQPTRLTDPQPTGVTCGRCLQLWYSVREDYLKKL